MTEEKIRLLPNVEIVQTFTNKILDMMEGENITMLEALTTFTCLIVKISLNSQIPKPLILSHISKTWEINDPETTHPDRDENSKIIIGEKNDD